MLIFNYRAQRVHARIANVSNTQKNLFRNISPTCSNAVDKTT